MKMEGAQCEQMSVIVAMAKEPGPHGCTLGGVLLLYHPPRPLGPGVFLRHSSLKHFLSRQAGHHCLSRWVEGRVGNLKAGRSVSWRPSGRVVCAL